MAKAKTPGGRRPAGNKAGGTRTAAAQAGGPTIAVEPSAPKKKVSIPQFFSQVRAEGRKIVWPSRKETWITSVMVLIMVAIAAAFFWGVDTILSLLSQFILSIGR